MAKKRKLLGNVHPAVIAVWSALLSRGKGYIALPVLALSIVLWFTQKIGRDAWIFAVVFGGYGAVCMILATIFAKKFLLNKNVLLKGIAIFLCGVSGMITAAMLADFASLILFKTPAITWKMLTFVSPVERTLFSVAAMIVGMPLLVGLPKIGIFVGPQPEEELEEDEDEAQEME